MPKELSYRPSRQSRFLSIVFTLMTPPAVFALGTGPQIDAPDSQVPTAIERALIERTCGATDAPSAEIDAQRQCFSAQLLSLRTDFGRDLSRLPDSDRQKIDAACNRLHTAEQREAYLDCLGEQLVALRNRQSRGNSTVSEDAAVASSPLLAPSVVPVPPARSVSSWPPATMIGGAVGSVLAAAGFVFLAVRSRRARPRRSCRVCGVDIPDSDLCPTCRHEAAEALRRAGVERAHQQRAQQEEERRQREYEAEQREQRARDDEEARMREQEAARRRQQTEEDAHRQRRVADVPIVPAVEEASEEGAVFDPYLVLGVPREAGQDDIRAAYQQAKTRYDPDLVSYLGAEAQAHFKAKAQSVELAYQMLSDVRP